MRSALKQLHSCLGACRAVAAFLGYSRRGYMHIRRRILGGQPIPKRTKALISQKLSTIAVERRQSQLHKGVTTVTKHIKSSNSNHGGAGFQKEFNKARRKIQSLLQAGKSRKDVHERLTAAGRLGMSYVSFCGFVNKEIDKDPLFLAPQPTDTSESRRQGSPPAKKPLKR
jgi:hypothetical protein